MLNSFLYLVCFAIVLVSLSATEAGAASRGFSVGAGPSLVNFDSNFKITNTDDGSDLFIDTEGTLGLPEKDTSPLFLMSYRISNKHSVALSYVGIRRQNELANLELDLGDYTAYGNILIRDTTKYYSFNYGYTLFEDDRSFVLASFGIFGLDLGLSLEAVGGIRNGEDVIEENNYEKAMGVFAPLPLFGLDFWWAYTSRWGLGSKIAFVGGSYADVKAVVVDTSIRGIYRMSKHFEAFVGVKYFSGDITINDAPYRNEIKYGLNGLIGGIGYRF
ncbi:hypothetical protein P886_0543 [Alteromonadaceae bacterium 2753L.S.0a.02]|nr:hypothetical protein P886_0543 [Alteromonadaceae bacterium 2753L.S.0a.02]